MAMSLGVPERWRRTHSSSLSGFAHICLRSKPSSAFEDVGIGDVHRIAGGKGEELIEGGIEQELVAVLLDIAQVWSADNVIHMQQWMVRDRLALIHIDRCIPRT